MKLLKPGPAAGEAQSELLATVRAPDLVHILPLVLQLQANTACSGLSFILVITGLKLRFCGIFPPFR